MSNQSISDELFELLNGKNLVLKQHEAMMLLTMTEDMWPHTAMVSVGEVVALSPGQLRIGLWPDTTTTNNIIRTGKAMLVVVYKGKVYYLRLSMQRLEDLERPLHNLVRFSAGVESFREDIAKYADITSSIQIQLKDPDDVLKRWSETVEELKQ